MLLNTLASEHQLTQSPSRQDGIPEEIETEIRIYGCQLIQSAGMLLELLARFGSHFRPQRVMATAQVLYQRFWFVSSLKHFSSRDICMGAMFLSTKLEESPARLRDLINVFDYLFKRDLSQSRKRPGRRVLEKKHGPQQRFWLEPPCEADPPLYEPQGYFDTEFYEMKDALVVGEMQLLKRLGFNVQVNLPYATTVNYLQLLELSETRVNVRSYNQHDDVSPDSDEVKAWPYLRHAGFAQTAWSFLNDALQTSVYCLFPPHVLACSVVYLTAETAEPQVALPVKPLPWWELFDVQLCEIQVVCCHILRLYHEDGPCAGIRAESGGLVEMLQKSDVREWLSRNGDSDTIEPRRP